MMNVSSKLCFAVALLALTAAVGCGPRIPAQQIPDAQRVAEIRKVLLEGGGGAATAEARPDPQGWGTLTGTFRVEQAVAGQLANRPALSIGGDDAAFCNAHGAIKSESVVVDGSTGAVRDVVMFLADDLSKVEKPELWLNESAAPGKTEPMVFDQKNCVFLTHVLGMQTSQPLEIHNSDQKSHNTKLDPSSNPAFNQTIAPGSILTYQHQKEERAPYKASCSVHPWMNAWIFPRNNSYFAVTGEDGKFTIPNLPAGVPLTFKVWQEKAGFVKQVKIDGKDTPIPSKGIPLTIPVDGELKLDIVIDAQPLL
jgi:hypothetical protein